MKAFKKYIEDRRAYHLKPTVNSVHRSSLLISEMPDTTTEITFLNHFLLKRNYENVGCRITGLDSSGERIESRLYPVTEPRVYAFDLSAEFDGQAANYLVEFFSGDNLFIPFPAVMINHVGDGFQNVVHASNRVLNDVFEDDQINQFSVAEAAIDVHLDDATDTFFVFATGVMPVKDVLEIELAAPGAVRQAELPVDMPRLSSRLFGLKEVFPDLRAEEGAATLKIRQPQQFLFYGRLFSGIRNADGSFSANHSYYDNSDGDEYWDEQAQAYAVYPFMPRLENRIRIYPIMAPGTLQVFVTINGTDAAELGRFHVGEITSPGQDTLDIPVNDLLARESISPDSVSSFCLTTEAAPGKLPTRVNHQMIYRGAGMGCSINSSLTNDAQIFGSGKRKVTWGQVLVGGDYNTQLGFVFRSPSGEADNVSITYYGLDGELGTRTAELRGRGSILVDMREELSHIDLDEMQYVWFSAESDRQDLNAWSVSQNLRSGHCSGEHSF